MKSKFITCSILLATTLFLGFSYNEISQCYLSFNGASNLVAAAPDRLPENSEKVRNVKTDEGDVEVTRIDGYRVLYNNNKNAPFVNLKVELSKNKSYETDQTNLIKNLKYLISHSQGMEKDLVELEFNGYKVYGLSRASIEAGSTLGIFLMFPGNGVTVHFYFNNMKPEFRNFESVEDYKVQRDRFIDEYTKYLINCNK